VGGNGDLLSGWGFEGEEFGDEVLREASPSSGGEHPFDFEERTARFGEEIVRYSKRIPHSPTNNRLIDQLVGAATSIGANYCEANESYGQRFSLHHHALPERGEGDAALPPHGRGVGAGVGAGGAGVLARGDGVDSDTFHDEG